MSTLSTLCIMGKLYYKQDKWNCSINEFSPNYTKLAFKKKSKITLAKNVTPVMDERMTDVLGSTLRGGKSSHMHT